MQTWEGRLLVHQQSPSHQIIAVRPDSLQADGQHFWLARRTKRPNHAHQPCSQSPRVAITWYERRGWSCTWEEGRDDDNGIPHEAIIARADEQMPNKWEAACS